jgi:hypothetical protein
MNKNWELQGKKITSTDVKAKGQTGQENMPSSQTSQEATNWEHLTNVKPD